ncbi:uncharacterized protein Osi23 [Chelonus insularis]|uniref:uncharacterized protein Osi23 n=1 Tax=Chelonus insularis TaxID=460826 RepID=UPI001588AF17|nr:uncharacterized protein LOC118072888 [Chelonus insularis]
MLIKGSTVGSDNWSVTLNTLLKNCASSSSNSNNKKQSFLDGLRSCLQKRALIAMDAFFSDDVIPILNGIDLVKFKDVDNSTIDVKRDKNQTNSSARRNGNKTWREIVFQRLANVFKTHVLKIDIDQLINRNESIKKNEESFRSNSVENEIVEGRRRHRRRHQLMPMMMMGLLLMGSVLIPMGFQFLAVLGGKALILAKLALMLSSIQGLKKVATSGVNYGLYHSGPVGDGWHDRSHQEPISHYGVPYPSY